MKKKVSIFILIFLSLLSLTFISAQPPFQTSPQDIGISIDSPVIEYHKQNQNFNFIVHIYNSTDGLRLTNETSNCLIHIFRPSDGEHIISENMSFASNLIDFEFNTSGENFTEIGQYAVLYYCEVPGEIGGFFEYGFEITKTGKQLSQSESQIYLILAFGVLLLFILSFYFMISTPYGNEIDDKGAVIKVSKLKYIKIGLILLTWVLFTWFLNILIGLSDNFVSLTMYYGFFGFIFQTMNNLVLPLGVFMIVLSLFEIIKDVNIQEAISKFGSSK